MSTQGQQSKSQSPAQGGTFSKPKIAFTYQNNEPGTNISNTISPQIKTRYNKGGEFNTNNVTVMPNKPSEKENSFTPHVTERRERNSVSISQYLGQVQETKIGIKDYSFSAKNTSSNKLTKKGSAPNVMKYPPLSPKLELKKINRCPTFLNPKLKTVGQSENSIISEAKMQQINVDCRCGKPITHIVKITGERCCPKCGITKMMQGFQLESFTRYIPNPEIKTNRSMSTNYMSKTIEQFIKEIKQEKQNVQKYYKEIVEGEIQIINEFYKERKLQLKNHYEKIKSAIKESITEDLKQMEVLQQQQIDQWKKVVNNLQLDYQKLQQIENELKQKDDKLSINWVKKQLIDDYQQIVARIKNQIVCKGSKICSTGADCDSMNASVVSNSSSNYSAIPKNFNTNGEVYKSDMYRMIKSKFNTMRPTDLTSTNYPSECQPSFLYPNSQKDNIENQNLILTFSSKLNSNNINNKNLLFSFDGEKWEK